MTYTIDPDVARIARRFAGNSKAFPMLIQAVVKAEGDILKAVRCSVPTCKDREEAIEITCRSAVHAMSEFTQTHQGAAYVEAWAQRWAPPGAANDPTALNKNWPVNVKRFWGVA